jgi:hypothetical protein
MDFEFRKDKYKGARGTHSRLLNLFCRICGEKILVYQKDGPGNLRRLYFDRILSPKKWTNLESRSLNATPTLTCPKCKEGLGTPYIYRKENRKAFKVYQDALIKKIIKLKED